MNLRCGRERFFRERREFELRDIQLKLQYTVSTSTYEADGIAEIEGFSLGDDDGGSYISIPKSMYWQKLNKISVLITLFRFCNAASKKHLTIWKRSLARHPQRHNFYRYRMFSMKNMFAC